MPLPDRWQNVFPSRARLRDVAPRGSEICVLGTGTRVWRIYRREPHSTRWSDFRHHGPLDAARFDHHIDDPPSTVTRSILYAAERPMTCIAEVFQHDDRIDPFTGAPRLAEFAFRTDLRLLDVASTWITRAGGSMAISAGERAMARRWSGAIDDAFPDVHGLRHASSKHAGERATHSTSALRHGSTLTRRALAHPELEPILVEDAAHTLGYDLSHPVRRSRPQRKAPCTQRDTRW